jgi:hypothetical protein
VKTLLTIFIAAAALKALADAPAATNAPAKNTGPIKSVFSQPKKFAEGRDPFFPDSTRAYQAVMAENTSKTVELSALVVKGYYRDKTGAYVIINNRTFGVGEDRDVQTPGGHVHIKCVDILPDNVVIEYNGSLHQLPINAKK